MSAQDLGFLYATFLLDTTVWRLPDQWSDVRIIVILFEITEGFPFVNIIISISYNNSQSIDQLRGL